MDVLVLGGTKFVGRAAADQAVAAGHRVTVFNRGLTGAAPAGTETVTGDRTRPDDLGALAARRFDLVVDTWIGAPAVAGLAAATLRTDFYAFVSSVSVYPGWPEASDYRVGGTYDGDPDAADPPPDLRPEQAYGWSKVGAERAVGRALGADRCALMRAASITGPNDGIGRVPWWLARVARGGRVLAPGGPDDAIANVDARDLADLALARVPGVHEVAGPPLTRASFLEACAQVTGSAPEWVWVDPEWLAGQDVEPWTEVPLWVPGAPSLFRHDPSPALRCRPPTDTLTDTWAWMQGVPGGWQPAERTPGMDPAKEALLLKSWDERS